LKLHDQQRNIRNIFPEAANKLAISAGSILRLPKIWLKICLKKPAYSTASSI